MTNGVRWDGSHRARGLEHQGLGQGEHVSSHGEWVCFRRGACHVHRGQAQALDPRPHDRGGHRSRQRLHSGMFWRCREVLVWMSMELGVLPVGSDTSGRLKSGLRLRGVRGVTD